MPLGSYSHLNRLIQVLIQKQIIYFNNTPFTLEIRGKKEPYYFLIQPGSSYGSPRFEDIIFHFRHIYYTEKGNRK